MITINTSRALIAVVLSLLLLLPGHAVAASKHIFILHAYSQEYPWTRNQHAGFVDSLREMSSGSVLFATEYLDTKRKDLDAAYMAEFTRYLSVKYADYQPDVVYVTDDNALTYAREAMPPLFSGVPLVFSGVNDYSVLDWIDTKRMTGVFEKKEIAPNLRIIAATGYQDRKVAFVGDGSSTDVAIRHEIEQELIDFPMLKPVFISAPTIEGIVEHLAESDYGVVFLTTIGGIKDGMGNNLPLSDIIRRIASSGDFILLSMEDAYLYPGVLGGYLTSGSKQGIAAASLVSQLLRGTPVHALPPVLDSPNEFTFDESELTRWGIELPEEIRRHAALINPLPTFYQVNRENILGSLYLLAALLVSTLFGSIILVSRKNRALKGVTRELMGQHEQLLLAQENLIEAQRIANMGSWTLDLTSNQLHWSDEIFTIFEIDKERFQASYEAFLETIHPDDREEVNQAYLDSVANKTNYEIQHRLLMPDGRIKYVLERGGTNYDAQGNPVRSVGTVQDITERVHAEQRLKQWAEVFESTIEGVIITDDRARIVDVNRAFSEITGYSREEVLGSSPNLRRSERHDADFYQAMWQSIKATGSWRGEIWNRKKSGELSPEWLSITTLYDDNHKVSNYIGVFTDISVLKRSEERLEHLANHDPLTSLPNRNLLNASLEGAIRRSARHGNKVAVLFLDLDRFKIINDTLGHAIGDRVLKQAAERMSAVLRDVDTIGRLGGDEFLAIIEDCGDSSKIEHLSERICQSMAKPISIDGRELFIGVSVGISVYPDDATTASVLIRDADSAMYQAKKSGRSSFAFYDSHLTEHAIKRMDMDTALRRALERKEFQLYYQPKIELSSGKVSGAEVLLRWWRDGKTMVSPDQFIPLAEESGLIIPIGEWVLQESVRQMDEWMGKGASLQHLAVNLSAVQVERGNIPALTRDLLARYEHVQPAALEMEITESVLFDYPEKAWSTLNDLRRLGVTLAMDDFGTGFSSLINLKRYPIDTIKIDRSFISDLLTDQNDEAITKAVLAMGKSLNLTVVAEGVEGQEQAEYLKALGCDFVQGYFYGRPVPAGEFEKLWLVL